MRRFLVFALLVIALGCGSQTSHQVAGRHEPVPQTQNNELTVYITDTGKRYHVSTCRHLRLSKHAVALGEAKRRGYTPCKVCRPAR